MARIIIEDMKLNKRREPTVLKKKIAPSVDIPIHKNLPKEEIKKEREVEKIKEEELNQYFRDKNIKTQRISRTPHSRKKSRILHKPTIVIFIICFIIFGVYWGGNILEKATITITAKHQLINYNNKPFVALKSGDNDSVNFEIMIMSDKKTRNVILTDSKDASINSTGSITLYNEFSANPQKLVTGTFIVDENGLTYKTNAAVTIPGYKNDANKNIIPGKVNVSISSVIPGENYNGSPENFYINSFKNTTKYNKIYGKLNTPLTGGAQGLVYFLNDSDKSKLDKMAQSYLKEDLIKKVEAQIPPNYMLYPDAIIFSYEIEDNFVSKTPEADVPINGTLSVVLLNEKSLIDNIIKISLPNADNEELKEIGISDLNKLSFSFVNKDQLITKDVETLSFYLTGEINAIWKPNIEVIKSKLIGINKGDVLPIFKQDKGIASALVKLFPAWKNYIPEDMSKIDIVIK